MLQKMESILTHPKLDATNEVAEFYGTDFNLDHLQTQPNLLHTSSETSLTDLKSVIAHLKMMNDVEKNYFSEVTKLVKIILVMPAMNTVSERSFSALKTT